MSNTNSKFKKITAFILGAISVSLIAGAANNYNVLDNLTQTVTISGTPNVAVTNIPHTIVDSGAITATVSGTPNVAVTNTPAVTCAACATETTQSTGNTTLSTISTTLSSILTAVTNSLAVNTTTSQPATYSYFTTGYAAYATPTDLVCITGSATKVVKVHSFQLLINTTAAALQNIYWIRRSTADTGGTPTNLTATKLNSANAAATATVTTYGSAPALGTSAGTYFISITNSAILTAAPASAVILSQLVTNASLSNLQSITLANQNEQLCANYNGAALTGGFTAEIATVITEN